jgi:hypothetical protein
MPDDAKPQLYLLSGTPDVGAVAAMSRALTGREPTGEGLREVREILEGGGREKTGG